MQCRQAQAAVRCRHRTYVPRDSVLFGRCPCTQVDPTLSRTVLVSTKLDTRIPQFARPSDCEMFIRPTMVLEGCSMLGDGPFFT